MRIIWNEQNFNELVTEMKFSTHFRGLIVPFSCGMFDPEVIVSGVKVKVVHFTDFIISDGKMILETDETGLVFKLSEDEELSFQIIKPGITTLDYFILFLFY